MPGNALDRQLADMERDSGGREPQATGHGGGLSPADRQLVRRALAGALAPATRRAYLAHWAAFEAWAAGRGYDALPSLPETVAAHLAHLAASASVSTLRVRRAAVGAVHRARGLSDPTASELVGKTLVGLARQTARPQMQARPLSDADLAAIRATALRRRTGGGRLRRRREGEEAARRRGLVDIALCSVMRDALLRRGEAAALNWGDISSADDGSGRLAVRRSKGDPEASGAVLYLGPRAMRDLQAIRPAAARPGDPVFGISGAQINRRIQAAARAAGLPDGLSGHSARVGMAQDLAADGASLAELMQAGRWKSSSMPARYTRSQAAGRGAVAKYHAKRTDPDEQP
ncbi:MAG: tyrosine-type recombinase/integrase [Bryobacterales bacterium]|nr:tyrosine-type recombinase/integrase [Bryobacterales bacterium]